MKKFLIAGLLLVGLAAYGAPKGVDDATVLTTATVLEDINVEEGGDIGEVTDPTKGGDPSGTGIGSGIEGTNLALGTMFKGDTKNTWTKIDSAVHPTLITIESTETDPNLVTQTESAHINYMVPQTVLIAESGGDILTVDLYISRDGGMGTPATGNYEDAQLSSGEYKFLIHGETTARADQTIADYSGNFVVYGRYDTVKNQW